MKARMNILVSLLLCCAAVFSCEKPDDGGKDKPSDPRSLTFSEESVTVPYGGGQFRIGVNANFEYEVEVLADWIREDEAAGSTSAVRYFVADGNPTASPREGGIRFSDKADRYYNKEVSVVQEANPNEHVTLKIVDKDATPQTKALLANLWKIADRGWMFGHHDDLWYGRYWYNEPGASDTKAVCGDYPAVFSVDFAEIMDNRYGSSANQIRRRVILEARERGEVILACAHLNNPKTGGDSWDNSSNEVVKEILTEGTSTRTKYLSWLDRLADFALGLKDSEGELVPVILRIYHEHTQGWSWWGSSCTTAQDFIDFWRLTVKYLRDTKGVHNFLYAISPQMDAVYPDARDRLLFRWPGDDWVDFIGMDCYHGTGNSAFISNLEALEALSLAKQKPCGVTEDGLESFTQSDFWSRYLMAPIGEKRISMVTMWRNKYVGNNESDKHYFSVYPGHPSEEDFRKMYSSPRTLFSADLPDMYALPDGYEIK